MYVLWWRRARLRCQSCSRIAPPPSTGWCSWGSQLRVAARQNVQRREACCTESLCQRRDSSTDFHHRCRGEMALLASSTARRPSKFFSQAETLYAWLLVSACALGLVHVRCSSGLCPTPIHQSFAIEYAAANSFQAVCGCLLLCICPKVFSNNYRTPRQQMAKLRYRADYATVNSEELMGNLRLPFGHLPSTLIHTRVMYADQW